MIGYNVPSYDDHLKISLRHIDDAIDRVIAAGKVAERRVATQKPILVPGETGFDFTAAMAWAKGDPEREAELKSAMFGARN